MVYHFCFGNSMFVGKFIVFMSERLLLLQNDNNIRLQREKNDTCNKQREFPVPSLVLIGYGIAFI